MAIANGRVITPESKKKVLALFTCVYVIAASANTHPMAWETSATTSSSKSPANEGNIGKRIQGFDLLSQNLMQTSQQVEKNYPYGWRFLHSFQGIRLDDANSTEFVTNFRGDFTFQFSGVLSTESHGVLLLVKKDNNSLPYLEVTFDIPKKVIVLRYLGSRSFHRVTFESVFPDNNWLDLEVSVHGKEATVYVDCQRTGYALLKQKIGAVLVNAEVLFGGNMTGQSEIKGVVFSAILYSQSNLPKTCGMQSDVAVGDQPLDEGTGFTLSSPSNLNSIEDRTLDLERRLVQLSLTVENLLQENSGLKSRVAHLETCECHPRCSFNGSNFREGDTWTQDDCIQCRCLNSKPVCERRFDLPHCAEPCLSNPCLNKGECINTDLIVGSFQCDCPAPFDGAVCEVKQNPIVWPAEAGNCDQQIVRYYYDKMSQQCLPFMFSGCRGNVNNYHNLEECTTISLHGACCYRTYKTNIMDVTRSTQELEIKCQELHMVECKALHSQPSGDETETEVINFNPGLTCSEAACQTAGTCVVGQRVYSPGDEIRLGCQDCLCNPVGQIKCKCETIAVRKEIRDMTPEELLAFQAAVAELRRSEDRTWEQFRDLYMYHVMHASNGHFFLPWQRAFLRQMEQRLQEVDCNIVLPYFDFTTDIGFFEEAVIWQSNYFGGNGDGNCVEDHPFGPKNIWQPCFVRNFNMSIQLPTQVELHLALATEDYEEMSLSLETFLAYVHNFIGGDMMTSSSPYDPVFYPIHAYFDMLYRTWQKKSQNKFKFPAAYGSIPMIPFNIPPWTVFDSETDLCVNYSLPSKGSICNVTGIEHTRFPGIKRGDTDPKDIYGYDRKDFDVHGFGKTGFNRDGYDRQGFDIGGFNRYGFNMKGYDRFGYNISGVDQSGNIDETGRFGIDGYDADCLNRRGLTREGLDQYGFFTNGLDKDGCSYYFSGPFCPIQSFRIFTVLSQQPKNFLMSLPRTCTGLSALPDHWLELNWVSNIKDVTTLVDVNLPDVQSGISGRFCFDTRPFLTSCVCDSDLVSCQANPCFNTTCRSFPEAYCRVSFCGTCKAMWFHQNKEVNCELIRDYCEPNPCMNGGTCHQSIWRKEPHLVTCSCPPHFDGHLCQHHVLDPCILPLSTGSYESQETRWYYNQHSGLCKQFIYLGCGGNANNFPSIAACQALCEKGACCSRQSKVPSLIIGFDSQGYDKYGFNEKGYNLFGEKKTIDNSFALGKFRFDEEGLDWQGFNREGFGTDGLNRAGFDRDGYDSEGFNISGYSRIGEYDGVIDYNSEGFDKDGFNRAGMSCFGNDRGGLDQYGVGGDYKYTCDITTLARCQERAREGEDIIKFSVGKTCQEAECAVPCGCRHGNQTFSIYQQFRLGCQTCSCTEKGIILCVCDFGIKRKEIREMSRDEISRYHLAVQNLLKDTGYPSKWYRFASMYAAHKPLAVGNPMFLPWNRQFLRHVEEAIQNIDCGIAIPYYDWTIDAGKPYKSLIWAANVMGGNGGQNDCVRYHPFKPYDSLYLSPCLRRRFNTSISLPSVVNIELALREPVYDKFRLGIEMFARVYQSFVGGHMDSDFAPFDPLYYSVMAFIDKLWMDWQDRHPEGLLSYPLRHRYARMDPFKLTPDDVFDSRIQLCVDYLPVAEGAPCNVSVIRTYDYDARGYDRHGYNRQGHDKDGFNVEGYDSSGSSDTRGIYSKLGYDKIGFKRSGVDDAGIDRHGFYIDSYNLDDFDAKGYDRSGYNRYGFNNQGLTPFGLNISSSYLSNVDIKETEMFDPFGYNKYGYNQEGFDRNGYDIFGFNAKGLDHRLCNYYFLGPIHILVKHYISRALVDLNETTLSNIKRICPQLSPLPSHTLLNYWFDRHDQRQILHQVYQHQTQRHAVDTAYTPRESSITTDLIWLPIAPDERLCLITEVYTHCSLGEPHIMCPDDLCAGRMCPGYSTAVCRIRSCGTCSREWHDGISGRALTCSGCVDETNLTRQAGETWLSQPCSSCVCSDGRINCLATECPQVRCQYPVMLPDQCCPSCEGCDYMGKKIFSGSEFRFGDNPCTTCRCENGSVQCTSVDCPGIEGCKNMIKPEGQCCPVCQDCGDREHGDMWRPSPCQECTCQAGHVKCTETVCPVTMCEHPYTVPGECCPQCSQCLYKGKVYRDGEEFSLIPCSTCTCVSGNVVCSSLQCDRADCENPVIPQGQCCPSCGLECAYEGKTYTDESSFYPEYDPCLNCSCINSIVRCRSVRCEIDELPCRFPIRKPGECCSTLCPSCEDQGVEHYEGDTWPSHNSPCEMCECQGGKVVCRARSDCQEKCSHGVIRPNECCSDCTDCLFEGRVVSEGDKISFSGGDICRLCTCQVGEMRCRSVAVARECPRLRCEKTETPPGDCCPLCAGCTSKGQKFRDGEEVSRDACSRCVCNQGEIVCDSKTANCPTTFCLEPRKVEGQCCPVCDKCVFYGQDHREGGTFNSPTDPCGRCICENGRVYCTTVKEECPPQACTHPGRRRDQCCPHCDSCLYQGRPVRNGQRFSGNDSCQFCTCQNGSISCTSHECPSVRCSKPVTVPGSCCPVCNGVCAIDGKDYRDGESFTRPGNDCSTCLCEHGQFKCSELKCDPPACNHPATIPGECCPKCNFCLYEKRTFRNQQRFIHPSSLCQECSCDYGTVTCQQTKCEDLTCPFPTSVPGSCCPVCPKQCIFNGLNYDDGGTFVSPRDKCEDCLCRQGTVQCKRRMCPPVECTNPVQDGCCPVCSGCTFGVLLLVEGEEVPDPNHPCQICRCNRASVQCHGVPCPPVACANPAELGCCPVCRDCEYRGHHYSNGEEVITETDRCRTCKCQNGTVHCWTNPCPAVTCHHPSRGHCCDECINCLYQGAKYRDGENFPDMNPELCQECSCNKGNVLCTRKRCPATSCTHPVQGPCCLECRNCLFSGQTVREGEIIPSTSNPCEECQCRQGSVQCYRKMCPPQGTCRYPIEKGCCKECTGCLYHGKEYRNAERFNDPASKCIICGCANGDVFCQQRTCPQVTCSNPVQGECCLECAGCNYDRRTHENGQRFPHPSDPCQECECSHGNVHCAAKRCPRSCTHPVSVSGECCPVCGRDCLSEGQVVKNGDQFSLNCQACTCLGGNIRCIPQKCQPLSCTHPAMVGCCQTCDECSLNGRRYQNSQVFQDATDQCSRCTCKDGSVHCERQTCPPVRCTHPAQGHCCPECDRCVYTGHSLANGQRFADQLDRCSACVCEHGNVSCSSLPCQPATCLHPINDECRCPVCNGCVYQGRQMADIQSFPSLTDPCQECLCKSGTVTCSTRQCSVSCSHPAVVTGCCPHCDGCLYEGQVRINGQQFVSDVNPCQKCLCQLGSVICETMVCEEQSCRNPIRVKGECCPSCPLCVFLNQQYQDNTQFKHPEDPCQTCSCKMGRINCEMEQCDVQCTHPWTGPCCPQCDACSFENNLYENGVTFQIDACRTCRCNKGNVHCDEITCSTLPCVAPIHIEGECCEVCQGCFFRGLLYQENATWAMPDNPCISCTCNGGLVTCMESDCYVPCSNPVKLPGQCCAVCPTCNFDGHLYADGEDFTPNGDPCDRCKCVGGYLKCLHNLCPSVSNCPAENLRQPASGDCCPSCSESFSTSCSESDIGKITRPRPEDPCFVCECKEDFMRVCTKEDCPFLNCPPEVQVYSPAQCCPSCPACYDLSEARYYHEGSTWSARKDPCIVCVCEHAEIKCSMRECEPTSCSSNERVVIPEGQCCEMCQPVPDATCYYHGKAYQPGTGWTVDECTSCQCQGGRVICNVRQCPPYQCGSDEAPVTTPGNCCPVCQKRPGTCLVFGDPHYRTFDGATLHFQGTCRYIMASDCDTDLFRVEVQHDSRGAPGEVSWAQNLTISVAGSVIDLLQDRVVWVNGKLVNLPFLYEPHILIEESGKSVLLSTEIGLRVLWDGSSYGEITVPGSFKRQLCGLCGNFNGFPQDDMRTRSGHITNSPATFGNSWKANAQTGEACEEAKDSDPCLAAGIRIRKLATSRCAILKGETFAPCHRVVSPEPFFASCVYDLCVCMDNTSCLCDILVTYAHECARYGVRVEWRSSSLCAFECDTSKGLMFDECGPVCPRTCESIQVAGPNITETCFKPCVASCQCTADKVLHDGRCISPRDCPYIETIPVI